MQPAGGSRSTTSRPSLRLTDSGELGQEFLSRRPSEGVYEQQTPVSRRSLPSLFSDPGDGQGPLLNQHPESFQTPPQQAGLYGQQTPVSRRSLPSLLSDPGDRQDPFLSQRPESFQTPPQQAGLYGQWTPVNREVFASNNAEFLVSTSSSRGSASSKLADQNRRE